MAPYVWVEQIESDLDGRRVEGDRRGARVGHGRASTAPTAKCAPGLIDEIVARDRPAAPDLRRAPAAPAGVAAQALRHRVQPRQHRARRRALAGDAAARAALGHGRALRAGRRGLTETRRRAGGMARGPCAHDRGGQRPARAASCSRCWCSPASRRSSSRSGSSTRRRPCQDFKLTPTLLSRRPRPRQTGERSPSSSRSAERGDGDDHRLRRQRRRDARSRFPGAALQTVLAALERPARHRARLRHAQHRAGAQRSSCPTTQAGSPRRANTACGLGLRDQPSQVLSPRSFTLVGRERRVARGTSLPSAGTLAARAARGARRDRRARACDAPPRATRSRCWRSSRCRSGCRSRPAAGRSTC